ncbi:hypothetical protein CEXT_489591 [Caerostris extrusa]|uniref:Uncharacterized protein n=1 Tax=Caerostris extrusa TaxID=172846 RepID=A0AAV4TBM6_CAEEX|nr:hypothetical protein CEXT_489591 [Caerostris extrusa]
MYAALSICHIKTNLFLSGVQVTATDGDRDRKPGHRVLPDGSGVDDQDPANSKFAINTTTGEIYVLKPLTATCPTGAPVALHGVRGGRGGQRTGRVRRRPGQPSRTSTTTPLLPLRHLHGQRHRERTGR